MGLLLRPLIAHVLDGCGCGKKKAGIGRIEEDNDRRIAATASLGEM